MWTFLQMRVPRGVGRLLDHRRRPFSSLVASIALQNGAWTEMATECESGSSILMRQNLVGLVPALEGWYGWYGMAGTNSRSQCVAVTPLSPQTGLGEGGRGHVKTAPKCPSNRSWLPATFAPPTPPSPPTSPCACTCDIMKGKECSRLTKAFVWGFLGFCIFAVHKFRRTDTK